VPDILTPQQVAEWLRCSRQHVINMADGRTTPKFTLPGGAQ